MARRVIILGNAGTGKTVLAGRLGKQRGLPLVSLDEMRARLGSPADWSAFRSMLAETHAGDAWISEGNFAQIGFEIRLPRAELIICSNGRGFSAHGG